MTTTGGTTTPFSPWIGSMITRAVSSVTAAASAWASPYGTWVTSPGSGRNGSRLPGCPVRASAPMVRPWKPPSVATMRGRPVSRPILNAASLASAPELQKKTLPSRPKRCSSCSARATGGSATNRLETCPSEAICRPTASTTAGWAWPRALTAIPPTKSRYSLPSASQSRSPAPRTRGSLGVP
ncbi:hypothetical protein SFUMM280S_03068 [Streptomyces fumanus]